MYNDEVGEVLNSWCLFDKERTRAFGKLHFLQFLCYPHWLSK